MTKNLLAIAFLLGSGSMEAAEYPGGKKSPVQSKEQNDKAAQAAVQFRKKQPRKGTRRSISLGDDEEDAPLLGLTPGQQVQTNKRAKNANARNKAKFQTQRKRAGLAAKAGGVDSDDEDYQDGYTDEDDNY